MTADVDTRIAVVTREMVFYRRVLDEIEAGRRVRRATTPEDLRYMIESCELTLIERETEKKAQEGASCLR